MKHLRNRETARLSVPVLMSQLHYPQSPVLYQTLSEKNFDTFVRLKHREEKLIQIFFRLLYERHEDLIKQIKNSVTY